MREGEAHRAAGGAIEPAPAAPAVPPGVRVTTPRERARAFVLLFLSLTCLGMGQTVIFAILPPLARELGLIDFQVGAIFMVSAIFWLVMSPFWGRRSDVWGRRPVIVIGLVGFVASTVLFAGLLEAALAGLVPVAVCYPLLVLSRTVYGLLGPGANSAAQAYVADRTTVETRTAALASIGAAFVLGTTFGPGLVWFLTDLGLLAPLYGVAGLGAASVIAIMVFLPERTGPRERAIMPAMSFWDARILEPMSLCVVFSIAQAIPVQTITFLFLDRFSGSPETAAERAALALLVSSVAMLLAQLVVMPRLRWPPGRFMLVGALIASAGFVLLVRAPSDGTVIAAMGLVGGGFALGRAGGVGACSIAVTPEEQGAVAGITGATGGAGFIVAPLLAFPLYALAPEAPFALCLALVVGVALWLIIRRLTNGPFVKG